MFGAMASMAPALKVPATKTENKLNRSVIHYSIAIHILNIENDAIGERRNPVRTGKRNQKHNTAFAAGGVGYDARARSSAQVTLHKHIRISVNIIKK